MALAHFRMLTHNVWNKDTDILPEEDPIIIFDSKCAVCVDINGKDANKTRHIYRRVNFVRNGEKWKIQKIDLCAWGIKLADIETKNVGENDWNHRIKYIMVMLDN